MADLDKPWKSPCRRPIHFMGFRLLMEEIEAIERKRTYKQVPKEPAANGQATLTV
jgi:hypothetical protein